jgi:hypothetical protein
MQSQDAPRMVLTIKVLNFYSSAPYSFILGRAQDHWLWSCGTRILEVVANLDCIKRGGIVVWLEGYLPKQMSLSISGFNN